MAANSNARSQLLTPSNLRLDSRLPLELRSLSFQILPSPPPSHFPHGSSTSTAYEAKAPSNPDGYSLVSHGLTKVSSSVFGPREPIKSGGPFSSMSAGSSGTTTGGGGGAGKDKGLERARINVEVGVAGWSERLRKQESRNEREINVLRSGGKDRRIVELAASIKATFEPVLLLHLYPRSAIDIYIQILEVDGALLQASINATTLALISAGLPLTDYICSLSLASYPSISPSAPAQIPPFTLLSPPSITSNHTTSESGSGSTVLLDLTNTEEQSLPNLTIAVLPRSGKITLVGLENRLAVNRFEEMLRWGVEGAKVLQGAMEQAVRIWANDLARPSKNLRSLFPGLQKDEDQMSE